MNLQDKVYSIFLNDTYATLKKESSSAVECFSRLRLYMNVTSYEGSMRELFLKGGFTSKQYDELLCKYNKELSIPDYKSSVPHF